MLYRAVNDPGTISRCCNTRTCRCLVTPMYRVRERLESIYTWKLYSCGGMTDILADTSKKQIPPLRCGMTIQKISGITRRLQFACGRIIFFRASRRVPPRELRRTSARHPRRPRRLRPARCRPRRRTLPHPRRSSSPPSPPSPRASRTPHRRRPIHTLQAPQPPRPHTLHRVDAHRLRLRVHPAPLPRRTLCLRPRRSPPPSSPAPALRPARHHVAPSSARLLHQPPQQKITARVLRPLALARRRRALLRCRARPLPTAPLLRRPRALSRTPRLRLRRDEQVHAALQGGQPPGLHP